jgi:hypothetical protein
LRTLNSRQAAYSPTDQGVHNQSVVDAINALETSVASVKSQLALATQRANSVVNNATLFGEQGVDFGSGTTKAAFVGNSSSIPAQNPPGGYFIWAQNGALKGRGTSSTVTTIGTADPHCPVCGGDFALEWENENYGYTMICIPCLHDFIDNTANALKALNDKVSTIWQTTKAMDDKLSALWQATNASVTEPDTTMSDEPTVDMSYLDNTDWVTVNQNQAVLHAKTTFLSKLKSLGKTGIIGGS